MLEWNETGTEGHEWRNATIVKIDWVIRLNVGGYTLSRGSRNTFSEVMGTRATLDEAKELAQRLQDVLDGHDAVSEAVERIVSALEKMRPKTRECAASSPVFTGYDDAMADAILILRSRDWSKGEK